MVNMLDFYADWCGPCKAIKPIIDEVGKEFNGKLHIQKIDVDKEQDLAHKYNVSSIPTLVLEQDGKEVGRLVGAQSKDALVAEIKRHIS